MQRPGNIFHALLTEVLERVRQFISYLLEYGLGDTDPVRFGKRLEPRRDIDPIAVDVLRLGDHVAQVDAYAKADALVVSDAQIAMSHAALHLDRAENGFDDTG